MTEKLVSVERFLEKAGVSALPKGDTRAISRFISERDMDPYILDLIPQETVRRYAECLTSGEAISYGDMLTAPAEALRGKADVSDLQALALELRTDAREDSAVVNFEIGKAYCGGPGSVIDDVCFAKKTITLTDGLAAELRGILAQAGLPEFRYEFPGATDVRTGLILALDKGGSLVRYAAYGRDNGFPQTASDACRTILRLLEEA